MLQYGKTLDETYSSSLKINVVTENFNDEYLNICAKKGETVSITPQFLMFSEDYPDGTLTTIAEYIEWNTSSISSMTPTISDGTLTYYTRSKRRIFCFRNVWPFLIRVCLTVNEWQQHTTLFLFQKKKSNVGQSIPNTGQQNEYVSFTPNVTGRYKINWKSYSSSGNESLYDSKGNQVFRIEDYLGGYWLTKGETYCMKLSYNTPTNSNSYSIDLYY